MGEKPTPNPKPEKPKPADTRTEPDPLPSLTRIAGTWLEDGRRRRRVRAAAQNREEEESERLTGGPGGENFISLFFLGCDKLLKLSRTSDHVKSTSM